MQVDAVLELHIEEALHRLFAMCLLAQAVGATAARTFLHVMACAHGNQPPSVQLPLV